MKKRIQRKLKLSKETLRNLTGPDLREALGGATLRTCAEACTDQCFTYQDTCTASGCVTVRQYTC
jgi:hypothetical protein